MLINSYKSTTNSQKLKESEKIFGWIKEKISILEERQGRSVIDKNAFDYFKRDIQ